jgi:hypothetical protein
MTGRPTLAFQLSHTYQYRLVKVTAAVVELTDDGTTRNPSYAWYGPARDLADFAVSAMLSHDIPHAWGWHHEYRRPYAVDLHRAKTMSRVLARFERGLANLCHQLGDPEDFHTYLLYVARTLNIHLFLLASTTQPDGRGHHQADTHNVRDWIRDLERQHAGTE